jgi:hypothetical protein
MPFKPNRGSPENIDLDKLRTILNQTHTSQKNNPLYQFCNSLLQALSTTRETISERLDALEKKQEECCAKSDKLASDLADLSYVTWEDES